jgi:hypothetical protein
MATSEIVSLPVEVAYPAPVGSPAAKTTEENNNVTSMATDNIIPIFLNLLIVNLFSVNNFYLLVEDCSKEDSLSFLLSHFEVAPGKSGTCGSEFTLKTKYRSKIPGSKKSHHYPKDITRNLRSQYRELCVTDQTVNRESDPGYQDQRGHNKKPDQ